MNNKQKKAISDAVYAVQFEGMLYEDAYDEIIEIIETEEKIDKELLIISTLIALIIIPVIVGLWGLLIKAFIV